MTTETWTPERVEQLRSSVVNGLTCSQIAAQIGVTRNAVIGKIHRLGLSPGRPPGASVRACPPRARQPRAVATQRRLLRLMWSEGAPVADAAASPAAVDSAQPCSLLDLDRGKCRWPINAAACDRSDGSAGDFVFCGNAAVDGFSYCAGHARMAYRPPARRRA
jgi:GcrA cell cycle regulator